MSVNEWRKRTRQRLIDGFGGKCNRCGYNNCNAALDMHHVDPSQKEFTISSAIASPKSWDCLIAEARKCILLCNRCHVELHNGLWNLDEIEIVEFNGEETTYKKDTITGQCPVCGIDVYRGAVCCSRECAGKRSRKIDWPSTDQLLKGLTATSQVALAQDLGVSVAAIKKKLTADFAAVNLQIDSLAKPLELLREWEQQHRKTMESIVMIEQNPVFKFKNQTQLAELVPPKIKNEEVAQW